MKIVTWGNLAQKVMNFLIVQIFLTLVSLPILIAWGIPLSLLAPLGNLIFNPFLTAFLLLSSLIFFTEIIALPNGIFVWMLEQLTHIWHYCLSFSSHSVLYAFKKPPILLLCLIPLITLSLVHHPLLQKPHKRCIGLVSLLLCSWAALSFAPIQKDPVLTIPCNNGFVTFIQHNDTNVLLDPGLMGQRISAPSWISYTLIPAITKASGSLSLDCVVCSKIGKIQFEALQTLATKMAIKKIYLPAFQGELEPHIKKAFNRFYATARSRGTKIIRSYQNPIQIAYPPISVTLSPQKEHTYRSVSYMKPEVVALIDNESVPIYDCSKTK